MPGSWDATDATKSAGFIDLVQVTDEIKDGLTLGSNFIIYSSDQTWLMEFVGGQFIFNTRKLFEDAGVINQNCVVEAEGNITSLVRSISICTTGRVSKVYVTRELSHLFMTT